VSDDEGTGEHPGINIATARDIAKKPIESRGIVQASSETAFNRPLGQTVEHVAGKEENNIAEA